VTLSHSWAARLSGGFFTLVFLVLCACASAPPSLPYPAYQNIADRADIFLAELPGVRARPIRLDLTRRNGYYRIELPSDWTGSTGATPGKAVEVFVLAGDLALGKERILGPGGYAYVPPGGLGFALRANSGAIVMYRVWDPRDGALMQTPLILDSGLVAWQETDIDGVFEKELRFDPGSQERTWLTRIEAGTSLPWRSSLSDRDGYLVSGQMTLAECTPQGPVIDEYVAGGYFVRPPDIAYFGPESVVAQDSIWLLHEDARMGSGNISACPGGGAR